MATVMCRTKFYARAFLLTSYRTEPTNGIMNFASSRSEWPMIGFISIAVTSLNSIAQLVVVFKCKPAKRTFVLSYFWLPQYFGPMSISGCSGSPCCWLHLLDLMRFLSSCAAQLAGTLFRTKRCNQQPTQPQLVYSALGGRKCGRIPRTQPYDDAHTLSATRRRPMSVRQCSR